jgi:hypothetical protein
MSELQDFPGDVIHIPYRKNIFTMYLNGSIDLSPPGEYYYIVAFDRFRWHNWVFGTEFIDNPNVPLHVVGWKCRECKAMFFGNNFEDLQHGCTKNRDEYFNR